MDAEATGTALDRGTVLALVAMSLGVFLIANDFTALSVAIPNIESDFGATLNRAQWVVNGYTVVFGVLIVTAGRLADLYGRRRTFFIGAAIFAVFSLLAGLSVNVGMLIAMRALMGIGGALMWPAVLGMTYDLLPEDKAGLAGGLIIGVAGLGNAAGPLLGGALTETLDWRWIMFVNVPISIVAVVVTWRTVPEHRIDGDPTIDYGGIATLSAGVVLLLIALDQGPVTGYGDPLTIAMFGIGAVLLAAFVVIERRGGEAALIPANVSHSRVFAACAGATVLISASFFAPVIYLPQFLEKTLGYSAVGAGLGMLPVMATFAITSFVAGPIYNRVGARIVLSGGAAMLMLGMLLLSFLSASVGYGSVVVGMLVLGVGIGLFFSAVTTTAVTAVDPSQASLAGGIVYMAQIAGGSIGLGMSTAIVLSGATLVDGIALAFRVVAALVAIALVILWRSVPHEETPQQHHHLRLKRHHRAHG